ncbi:MULTISPECIES: hypothetical protein [Pseudomonas]|uniref:hypothetical protein n=1 Tax=Pseudomonas sp. MIL9 TaxID=2807620 RepID=UPI00167A35A8|nr:hypothetical protein [Pseudomonas sp. MIL9]MBM6442052.1 hypothetical protein [Pseudomonas sp. MIL9]
MENLQVYRGKSKLTCIGEAFTANVVQVLPLLGIKLYKQLFLYNIELQAGGADERG